MKHAGFRFLIFVLCLAIIVPALPVTAEAEELGPEGTATSEASLAGPTYFWPLDTRIGGTVDLILVNDEGKPVSSATEPVIEFQDPSMFSHKSGTQYTAVKAGYTTVYVRGSSCTTEYGVFVQFKDVPDDAYYYWYVVWAVHRGVTSGTSDTTFSPDKGCTRGQLVTFLWILEGRPEPTQPNPFADVKEGDYFYKAVLWAKEMDITSGTTARTFSPYTICTRAQCMTFLWNAKGRPPASAAASFEDISPKDYYYYAVLWARANNITSGTTPTTFGPNRPCTRAQVVTFLRNVYGGV